MRVDPNTFVPLQLEKSEKAKSPAASFGDVFKEALDSVNRQQLEADSAVSGLTSGEVEDVHQVMISTEKARLSLQLTTQVTNKVIEAYQEISRMQV